MSTVADRKWEKLRNGRLLAAASIEFDAFLTIDKNLKREQNLATLPVAVIVLLAQSNRLVDLLPLVPAVEEELKRLTAKSLVEVSL